MTGPQSREYAWHSRHAGADTPPDLNDRVSIVPQSRRPAQLYRVIDGRSAHACAFSAKVVRSLHVGWQSTGPAEEDSLQLSSKPVVNPAVICRQTPGGEAVLVNLDTAASLALNLTGLVVWRLLDGEASVDLIIADVRSRFEGVPDSVADEVLALLDILAEDGFIGFEWKPSDKI